MMGNLVLNDKQNIAVSQNTLIFQNKINVRGSSNPKILHLQEILMDLPGEKLPTPSIKKGTNKTFHKETYKTIFIAKFSSVFNSAKKELTKITNAVQDCFIKSLSFIKGYLKKTPKSGENPLNHAKKFDSSQYETKKEELTVSVTNLLAKEFITNQLPNRSSFEIGRYIRPLPPIPLENAFSEKPNRPLPPPPPIHRPLPKIPESASINVEVKPIVLKEKMKELQDNAQILADEKLELNEVLEREVLFEEIKLDSTNPDILDEKQKMQIEKNGENFPSDINNFLSQSIQHYYQAFNGDDEENEEDFNFDFQPTLPFFPKPVGPVIKVEEPKKSAPQSLLGSIVNFDPRQLKKVVVNEKKGNVEDKSILRSLQEVSDRFQSFMNVNENLDDIDNNFDD